mgnify:CR=1 FL=1
MANGDCEIDVTYRISECQYAFTSAASTSTLTAWPIRSTESTSRALGASFRIKPADDAAQRAVDDFHHHALADHRARVELQLAADEDADAVELVVAESAPACPRTTRCSRRRCT